MSCAGNAGAGKITHKSLRPDGRRPRNNRREFARAKRVRMRTGSGQALMELGHRIRRIGLNRLFLRFNSLILLKEKTTPQLHDREWIDHKISTYMTSERQSYYIFYRSKGSL